MNECEKEFIERFIDKLHEIEIECPECESIEDDQYYCLTCGDVNNGYDFLKKYFKEIEKIMIDNK